MQYLPLPWFIPHLSHPNPEKGHMEGMLTGKSTARWLLLHNSLLFERTVLKIKNFLKNLKIRYAILLE